VRFGGRVVHPWPHGQLQGMRKRRIRKEKDEDQKSSFYGKKRKQSLEFSFSRLYFRSFQQRMDQTGKQLFFSFHLFFPFLFQRGIFFFLCFNFPFFEVIKIIGARFFPQFF
jgi:hypothetical protein